MGCEGERQIIVKADPLRPKLGRNDGAGGDAFEHPRDVRSGATDTAMEGGAPAVPAPALKGDIAEVGHALDDTFGFEYLQRATAQPLRIGTRVNDEIECTHIAFD